MLLDAHIHSPRLDDAAHSGDGGGGARVEGAPPALPSWRYEDRPRAGRFEGGRHGSDVSCFVVDAEPGAGPELHCHPYSETFIVQEGTACFFLDGEPIEAAGGDLVVVPAGAAHMFRSVGPGRLRMVCIHASPWMKTTWL